MDVNILRPSGCTHWQMVKNLTLVPFQSGTFQRKDSFCNREAQHKVVNVYPCKSLEEDGTLHPCPKGVMCKPCVCLHCKEILCLDSRLGINQHFVCTGHSIGYCFCRSAVFCFQCVDFLYEIALPPSVAERAGLRGIVNFGNTCYMNCILQVLAHTPSLSDLIEINENWNSRLRKRPSPPLFCSGGASGSATAAVQICKMESDTGILAVFKSLLQEFQNFQKCVNDPVMPTDFLVAIWENIPHLAQHKQQDAHDFFLSILNELHVELSRFLPKKSKRKKGMKSVSPPESLIDHIFLGWMQSEVICTVCSTSRFSVDPFRGASLEMLPDNPTDLKDLLQQFTRLEHLEDKNELLCPCCNKHTKSTKQLSFKVLPPVICIQLKRFQHNASNFKKLDVPVSIPDIINLSPFKSESTKILKDIPKCLETGIRNTSDSWYRLYAIVNHVGTYSSGHYYTFVKKSNFWFKCDDHNVELVPQEAVLNGEGYLLFYQKA